MEKLNHPRFAGDIIIMEIEVTDIEEVMLQELDNASRTCGLKFNKDRGRNHTNNQGSICKLIPTWSNRRVCLHGATFYINRETPRQRNKMKDQIRMAGIWKTQHNYEGYTTNMLKKKGLQPVYPSSNDVWTLTTKMENELSAAQHNMEWMLNITPIKTEKLANKWGTKLKLWTISK